MGRRCLTSSSRRRHQAPRRTAHQTECPRLPMGFRYTCGATCWSFSWPSVVSLFVLQYTPTKPPLLQCNPQNKVYSPLRKRRRISNVSTLRFPLTKPTNFSGSPEKSKSRSMPQAMQTSSWSQMPVPFGVRQTLQKHEPRTCFGCGQPRKVKLPAESPKQTTSTDRMFCP